MKLRPAPLHFCKLLFLPIDFLSLSQSVPLILCTGSMASLIPESVKSAKNAIMGSGGDKVADLAKDTKELTDRTHQTSDYGVKLPPDTDHWLSASSEDRQGPSLIEDPFSREKVRQNFTSHPPDMSRSQGADSPDHPFRPRTDTRASCPCSRHWRIWNFPPK